MRAIFISTALTAVVSAFLSAGIAALLFRPADAQRPAEVIVARSYLLQDANGRIRASLDVGVDDVVALRLVDSDGIRRVQLTSLSEASAMAIWNRDGQIAAGLSERPGATTMYLGDEGIDGFFRMTLQRLPDEPVQLTLGVVGDAGREDGGLVLRAGHPPRLELQHQFGAETVWSAPSP